MPTVLIDAAYRQPPAEPPRKRWTRTECAALDAAGLTSHQHLELIEGELINKMGKKRPHVNTVSLMCARLVEVFGKRFVNPEAPIDVAPEDNPTNEPEPDVIVLNRDIANFKSTNPRPQDLSLVVEVADSSLAFDLSTKAALYARAGIVEYWVIDVQGPRLIVHRTPQAGRYTAVTEYGKSETVAPLAAPSAEITLADLLAE